MNFIQPVMLWGMLAIAVPIFIHIWNKQKGKVMEWAASQWLLDKSEQQHKGLRIDNLLLLVLRCLLIVLLAFLLSKPVSGLLGKGSYGKVHLVEPQKNVIENYRFELETALKNGEPLFWINVETERISDLTKIPLTKSISKNIIQKSISKIGQRGELYLYLTNRQELAAGPAVYVPKHFQVHPVVDTTEKAALSFKGMPEIKMLLDYQNPVETQTVRAALDALASVYGFPFSIDLEKQSGKKYDWILTDLATGAKSGEVGYVLSGLQKTAIGLNAGAGIYHRQPFQIQTSEIVSSGQLPEWLGEKLLEHYGLEPSQKPLSAKQFESLFVKTQDTYDAPWERLQKVLFAGFMVLLLLERGISLKKMNV